MHIETRHGLRAVSCFLKSFLQLISFVFPKSIIFVEN